MPKRLKNSRLHSNKHQPKNKQEVNNTQSNSLPILQAFKQELLPGYGFLVYKRA